MKLKEGKPSFIFRNTVMTTEEVLRRLEKNKYMDRVYVADGMTVKEVYDFLKTMVNHERHFFAQDSECHWYLLPESLRSEWEAMTQSDIDPEDYDTQERFIELFEDYMINTHPSDYLVENPQHK